MKELKIKYKFKYCTDLYSDWIELKLKYKKRGQFFYKRIELIFNEFEIPALKKNINKIGAYKFVEGIANDYAYDMSENISEWEKLMSK